MGWDAILRDREPGEVGEDLILLFGAVSLVNARCSQIHGDGIKMWWGREGNRHQMFSRDTGRSSQ